ncbi:hypothetical protein EKH79_01730 [Dyella dinghuensis]|uniref:Toxin co-regulated pilus biosynthesis protein Q C-terminal domain-containing protein n=1 Tax=Dyella dinghuensis TaxID=1920169 RepID=A0A3S0RG81_9GAMM|nr:TcpQ domain-containing protein [Dyella dinghuensis]RUL66569.1 hypothetical protein EKH79_01730 [Dyella dinghuensis]
MESPLFRATAGICTFAVLLLAGCATPSAPDYHGKWKPVNRYATTTTPIPLAKAYVFFATPMDGTLKTMLTRWAKDTGIQLSYNLGADYTLTAPAAQINTPNIRLAASQLNDIYASQGISVAVSDWQITVQAFNTAPSKQTTADAKSTTGVGVKKQ